MYKKNNIIKSIIVSILLIILIFVLFLLAIRTDFNEQQKLEVFIMGFSVVINIVLTIGLIILYSNQYKHELNKNKDDIKNASYVVYQELIKIYQIFLKILRTFKCSKEIVTPFYISNEWRVNLGKLVPFLPKTVMSNLFDIYSFCEYSNEMKANFSNEDQQINLISFVEINNIEYVRDSNDAYLLAISDIRFFFIFHELLMANRNIAKLDEKYCKYHKDTNAIVNIDNIKSLSINDTTNKHEIHTEYSNGKIVYQKVLENQNIIRNCTYTSDGLASGSDTFEIDKNLIFSLYYRQDKQFKRQWGYIFTSEKLYRFEGEIYENRLNGNGNIYKNKSLISTGIYRKGKLLNGHEYNVEIKREYRDNKKQEQYEYDKYFSSDEYIKKCIEEQEEDDEVYREEEYDYISQVVDYEINNGVKRVLEERKVKRFDYESDD